ncbi:MAG: sulfite exporter TauE/SafE family protein [Christensenellaceae bacterium]|jgi:sulfite exporter TauE/SafE/copper chaperone CopZ/plastocyanin domain-containing protein|nr:sulfite exporter TauE/SafE family protein [Christensenellaceae bacterium]
MESRVKAKTLRIGGMTCVSCQNRIEKKLANTAGIKKAEVSYSAGLASIEYDADILTLKDIEGVVERLGYSVLYDGQRATDWKRAAGILLCLLAAYMLARGLGLTTLLQLFPTAEAGMGYGMLFVTGLFTSVHCVAMCGGINLSQCIPGAAAGAQASQALRPGILYNLGRVLSYTVIGALVGALGSVIQFTGALRGLVQLVAGVFMVIMGLNMLGLFPWLKKLMPRLPKAFSSKIEREKQGSDSALYVGLLNGLMPCGPLQAMQIYALSTGSPVKGALSMLLFSLGTVPLMFGLGALSAVLSKRFLRGVMTVGAALVVLMGAFMFTNGWSLSGLRVGAIPGLEGDAPARAEIVMEDGYQIVNSTLASGRYPAITVAAGIPVKWTIDAPKGSINGCNNRLFIPAYDVEYQFKTGENIITFTPTAAGKYPYSCWMGMIRSSITVVAGEGAQGNTTAAGTAPVAPPTIIEDAAQTEPVAANVSIPADSLAIATIDGDIQYVDIELTDEGFSPAVVVVQAGIDVDWTIHNTSARAGNETLLVPTYFAQVPMDFGDIPLYLYPTSSFDFSTGDNAFYGFVKVVRDLNRIDQAAIKKEVAGYQTLIWPPETFSQEEEPSCH